ncbi:MAG TPA: SprT family zinc-dependent metalloprotease [Caulobacteraceae bacterium]
MIPFRASTYQHGDVLEMGGSTLRLSVNPRARRVSLRLDRTKGEVIVTAPSARRLSEAVAFARERAGWIAERVAELPERAPLEPGMIFDLFGDPVVLDAAPGRAKLIKGPPHRILSADDEAFSVRVLRLVKGEALAVLTERTLWYADQLGHPAPKVAIGDPRGRWGSCKAATVRQGASIRYSWRLALAPFEVADYVVAHEVAHLVEQNHSPRFWAVVKQLYGDHRRPRDWLRRESARLHAFGR